MNAPKKFERIVGRVRYSVEKSTLIAGDDHWDGHNFERSGRNSFLYKTQNGKYFEVNLSQWQGEETTLVPLSQDDAIEFFESCRDDEQRVSFSEAFPGVKIQDA